MKKPQIFYGKGSPITYLKVVIVTFYYYCRIDQERTDLCFNLNIFCNIYIYISVILRLLCGCEILGILLSVREHLKSGICWNVLVGSCVTCHSAGNTDCSAGSTGCSAGNTDCSAGSTGCSAGNTDCSAGKHWLLCREHRLFCREHWLFCREHRLFCREHRLKLLVSFLEPSIRMLTFQFVKFFPFFFYYSKRSRFKEINSLMDFFKKNYF